MVSFEPLAIDEANAFLDESIREFVSERVPADHADIAVEKIREELSQRLLPNGTLTNGHRFEDIISNGDGVGRVWFGQCRTTNQTCTSATSASPRSADVKVMPGHDVHDATELRLVREAFLARADAERALGDAVIRARHNGHSWASIGAMVGTSGEAARQRYGQSVNAS